MDCLPNSEEEKYRGLQIPNNLVKQFCEHAWLHSPTEFMGCVTGTVEFDNKAKKTIVFANGLWMPMEDREMHQVMSDSSALPPEMLQHMETTQSVVVGWIQSRPRPTSEADFPSVDHHMMYSFQKVQPLAFGIIVNQHKELRALRLSPLGMKEVANCTNIAEDQSNYSTKFPLDVSSIKWDARTYNHYSQMLDSGFVRPHRSCLNPLCKSCQLYKIIHFSSQFVLGFWAYET